MIIIPLLILTYIYIKFGLFVLIQISIWSFVFILATYLNEINPSDLQYKVIRILAIITILFIFLLTFINILKLSYLFKDLLV